MQYYFSDPLKYTIDIPTTFIHIINEYNNRYVTNQINNINDIINNKNNIVSIDEAIKWCDKYKIN